MLSLKELSRLVSLLKAVVPNKEAQKAIDEIAKSYLESLAVNKYLSIVKNQKKIGEKQNDSN